MIEVKYEDMQVNAPLPYAYNMHTIIIVVMFCFQIISGSFESQTINSVSDDVLKAGEQLVAVNPQRRNCLTTFVKCLELVRWLRENIKGTKLFI